ncbi:MAG: HEAT repeat domain-containing protein [Acidobacteriia bacterium]|nr:HEAT repeat domain-containing protein [Terriglobia bacterium]
MIRMHSFQLISTMLVASCTVALSQQPPEPPQPPQPLPRVAPRVPMPPAVPMAALAPMPPLPPDFADLALLAFQDTRDGRDAARRARDLSRQQQDRDERYYRAGKSYLDRKEYDKAIDAFNRVTENKGSRADGAYYWRAYAQNKAGRRDDALASLTELQNNYASSRWLDDAKALQVEIRQQAGQPVSPESATDEDLKLLALQSLVNTDPERSVPMLEKLLKSSNSPRLKERALFVLAQSRSEKSRALLTEVAKGGSNPDLQIKAIEYLGVYGGRDNVQALADVYKSSNDVSVKQTILNSFMVSGNRDNLLAVAKSETNTELKVHAIRLLGNVGGQADLAQLYSNESAPEVKRAIIQGLFVAGQADKLVDLAKNEKDAGLRHQAIQQLGVMGRSKTGTALAGMYAQETDPDNKKAIISALFVQGNAAALVEIARKESDVNMKKDVVQKLSLMHSKEASDYLMELLAK